jgi:hypothetical protein
MPYFHEAEDVCQSRKDRDWTVKRQAVSLISRFSPSTSAPGLN